MFKVTIEEKSGKVVNVGSQINWTSDEFLRTTGQPYEYATMREAEVAAELLRDEWNIKTAKAETV